ncbi:TPA: hypothetical protein N0F65_002158 [Lagenidium giganteum]|uniref:Chromo domain-containing protein n=1 Tax=Lagenidium giganteum TaxID=4803 RepID=A0AAV2YPR7_9STRA|nr:TPA: hypothetical protein N0F65_002158 [Lagenidium giganteum]
MHCRSSGQDGEQYNKNRRQQSFDVGAEVLLAGGNLSARHLGTSKKKLGARWVGPYTITKRNGRGYYQLKLPPGIKIHPVFHTSALKPYIAQENRREFQRLFKVRLNDGTEAFASQSTSKSVTRGQLRYEVKWLGQPATTWEPVANLTSIAGLIQRYHKRKEDDCSRGGECHEIASDRSSWFSYVLFLSMFLSSFGERTPSPEFSCTLLGEARASDRIILPYHF